MLEAGSRLAFWPSSLLPAPSDIAGSLVELSRGNTLLIAVGQSVKLMLVGYVLAIAIGVPLGVLIHQVPWLRQTVGALLLGLQTLPSVCWIPLAVLWFGVNMQAVLFVILVNSVFSIATSTTGALATVPPQLIQAGQTLGARGWPLMLRVMLPAALPEIVTGLRIGWTFAWRALMAGELVVPMAGMGQLLQQGRARNDIADILATMLVIVALGLMVELSLFARLDRRLRETWGLASV